MRDQRRQVRFELDLGEDQADVSRALGVRGLSLSTSKMCSRRIVKVCDSSHSLSIQLFQLAGVRDFLLSARRRRTGCNGANCVFEDCVEIACTVVWWFCHCTEFWISFKTPCDFLPPNNRWLCSWNLSASSSGFFHEGLMMWQGSRTITRTFGIQCFLKICAVFNKAPSTVMPPEMART